MSTQKSKAAPKRQEKKLSYADLQEQLSNHKQALEKMRQEKIQVSQLVEKLDLENINFKNRQLSVDTLIRDLRDAHMEASVYQMSGAVFEVPEGATNPPLLARIRFARSLAALFRLK